MNEMPEVRMPDEPPGLSDADLFDLERGTRAPETDAAAVAPAMRITESTPRPMGATGVHWAGSATVECFAVIDADAAMGTHRGPTLGQFVYYDELTGEDDCGCDTHRQRRRPN